MEKKIVVLPLACDNFTGKPILRSNYCIQSMSFEGGSVPIFFLFMGAFIQRCSVYINYEPLSFMTFNMDSVARLVAYGISIKTMHFALLIEPNWRVELRGNAKLQLNDRFFFLYKVLGFHVQFGKCGLTHIEQTFSTPQIYKLEGPNLETVRNGRVKFLENVFSFSHHKLT